jgi:hypothetical protein
MPLVTIVTWVRLAPAQFLATPVSELSATSQTTAYGAPHNSQGGSVQRLLFSPQTHSVADTVRNGSVAKKPTMTSLNGESGPRRRVRPRRG